MLNTLGPPHDFKPCTKCPCCGNEHVQATSPTTGCCNGERMAKGYGPGPIRTLDYGLEQVTSTTQGYILKSGAYVADLKNCPLCGRVPRITDYEDGLSQNGRWVIECKGCNLELATYFIMEGNPGADKRKMLTLAVRRWNRRVKA